MMYTFTFYEAADEEDADGVGLGVGPVGRVRDGDSGAERENGDRPVVDLPYEAGRVGGVGGDGVGGADGSSEEGHEEGDPGVPGEGDLDAMEGEDHGHGAGAAGGECGDRVG